MIFPYTEPPRAKKSDEALPALFEFQINESQVSLLSFLSECYSYPGEVPLKEVERRSSP